MVCVKVHCRNTVIFVSLYGAVMIPQQLKRQQDAKKRKRKLAGQGGAKKSKKSKKNPKPTDEWVP